MHLIRRAILAVLVGVSASPVMAQTDLYPSKPIRIVVPAAGGGGVDPTARRLGEFLSGALGQPVIIDNKPGANGALAAAEVMRAAPDGYTLLMTNDAPLTILPVISKEVKYDASRDLTAVSILGSGGCNVLVISADSPVKTLSDFIKLTQTDDVTYATPSVGSPAHIVSEEFIRASKVKMRPIHYKAAPPAMVDVMGGRVTVFFANTINADTHIKSGKLRPLAVSPAKRCATLPDVPTVAESGYAGFDTGQLWLGLFGPANLPAGVANKLAQAVATGRTTETLRAAFAATSVVYDPKSAAASRDFVAADVVAMKKRLDGLPVAID